MSVREARINLLAEESLFRSCSPFRTLRDEPLGFVDVGASGGISEVVRPIAGLVSVLAFEPDPEAYQSLRADRRAGSPWARYHVEPLALYSKEKDATLNMTTWPYNNSLLIPNRRFVDRYSMVKWVRSGTVPLRTASLDSILFGTLRRQKHQGEFLKLDTQGTEFEIMKGAERTITERTVAILTEVEFAELYERQKLFADIERFLRARGFSFYGFTTMHLRSLKMLDKKKEIGRERIFQADAVFFKDPLPGGYCEEPLSKRGNHVLFVSALLLGYYDFALELALKTWAEGREALNIRKLVHKCASFPARKTYREMLSLVRRVQSKPELANIEVGRLLDERRYLYDYSDALVPQHRGGLRRKSSARTAGRRVRRPSSR